MFFDFCQESGYQSILQVLGSTTRDFLQNLDALHDHLATIYPGMRAPSFCCTERPEDGATILHYYSEREGLESIVIGLVKTVAKKLHDTQVDVKVYKTKSDGIDHVQFLILESGESKEVKSNNNSVIEDVLSNEPKISLDSFATVFPFHLMFNSDMVITQAGKSISRLIPDIPSHTCNITDLFTMVRPHMEFTFANVTSHVNTIYVLSSRPEKVSLAGCSEQEACLRLKGEMVWVREAEAILFLCSPAAASLDELWRLGMHLSDIPLHDATRDLVLLSEEFHSQYKLTRRLELLNDKLQQTYQELEDEKKKTDK